MADGEINYDGYSDVELREALLSVDREAFPRNFQNLQATLRARGLDGPPPAGHELTMSQSAAPVEAADSNSSSPEITEFIARLQALSPATPVTLTLIAINVVVFVAMAIAGAGVLEPDGRMHVAWGSNLVPITVDGQWWRLGTSMFLHFGLIHLMLNMWVLYVNGVLAERMFGSTRFLILYLFAGVAGSLASAAWHPAINSAGASGAIFGVLGGMAAFVISSHYRVPREVIRAQGKSIAAFVFYNVAYGLIHPGIDNAAHFGGLVGGFLIGMALARPITAEARAEPRRLYLAGIATLASLLLVVGAGAVLYMKSHMSPDDRYMAAALWFDYREPQVLGAYNDMIVQSRAGKLTDGGFSDRLAAEVIPFYAEAGERLHWEPGSGSDTDESRRRVGQFIALRYEAMSKFDQALRERNAAGVAEAMEVLRRSGQAAEEINAATARESQNP